MEEHVARMRQKAMAQVQRIQLRMIPQTLSGEGCLGEVAPLLARKGVKRVLLVTTPGFVKRGTLKPLIHALGVRGIYTAIFGEVAPDPDTACVEKAAMRYREAGCQAIIAVGGGSAIDCAKVAGALAVRPRATARSLVGAMKVARKTPFLVAVPTTAGTGSEVTAAAVITDADGQRKYAISDLALIPDVAVLDPQLLVGLPAHLTAYAGMDALTHAVEAFTNLYGAQEARDRALKAVVGVYRNLKASYDDGGDPESRMQMLWASYDAGIAFTNAYVGYVHALAHAIGGRYHVPHGLANAVLLPYVMEEFGASAEPALAVLAHAVGITGADEHQLAQAFIRSIRELASSMGIGETIPEVRQLDIPTLAAAACQEGNPAYPVPALWEQPTFEKVLGRVCTQAAPQAGTQVRIVEPGPLLNAMGGLATPGWATQPLLRYDRAAIKAPALRVKEWDYYLVNDDECALALTIGDMGYASMVSAAVIDFRNGTATTRSTMGVLPLGRLGLPASPESGTSSYSDAKVDMRFEVAGGLRRLVVAFRDFDAGQTLTADIVLDQPPRDTMVIATPWAEDPRAFYYNQKVVGMRAVGSLWVGTHRHDFREDRSFGLLDWGRGVWTRDNTWYWSAAQGRQGGRVVGFNLGYGFGDTSAASENMLFVDGVAHKLGRVDFGIPMRNPGSRSIGSRFDLMAPWHLTDDEGRLDLVFTPRVDRSDRIDLKAVVSDQHQVFGTFSGTAVLDNGSPLAITDLTGFAEAVHNKY